MQPPEIKSSKVIILNVRNFVFFVSGLNETKEYTCSYNPTLNQKKRRIAYRITLLKTNKRKL